MSDKIFLDVVNMSITGSFAILIIILVRLLLRKAPKVFSYTLWFVAFFRLLVPFSFESVLSILPFNTMPLSTDMQSLFCIGLTRLYGSHLSCLLLIWKCPAMKVLSERQRRISVKNTASHFWIFQSKKVHLMYRWRLLRETRKKG